MFSYSPSPVIFHSFPGWWPVDFLLPVYKPGEWVEVWDVQQTDNSKQIVKFSALTRNGLLIDANGKTWTFHKKLEL